jgi:hypothetical protein
LKFCDAALIGCSDWNVVVNLRPDEDFETEFVAFDRPRVVRVLERIAADLDNLSLVPNDPHADKESNHHDPRARHRHELAEPPQKPKKLSHREQRTAFASSAATAATVRKSDRVFRKLNALALFSVPLLLGTLSRSASCMANKASGVINVLYFYFSEVTLNRPNTIQRQRRDDTPSLILIKRCFRYD